MAKPPLPTNKDKNERRIKPLADASHRITLAISFLLIGIVLILESLGFLVILQLLMSTFTISSSVAWILWVYTFIKTFAGIFSAGFGLFLFFKK